MEIADRPGQLAVTSNANRAYVPLERSGRVAVVDLLARREVDGDTSTAAVQYLIREHEKKLNNYTANPDAYDNEGILKDAPNPQIRQKIIQGRRGTLEKQIKKQRDELNKIE